MIHSVKNNNTTNKPARIAKPILTIGSSIHGDIKSKNPKELIVHSVSGAKIKDISSAITKMSKDKMTFSKVILMAGSNDCSCSDSTTQSIMQDMVEAVAGAKKVSSEVCISSIIPRTDEGSALPS